MNFGLPDDLGVQMTLGFQMTTKTQEGTVMTRATLSARGAKANGKQCSHHDPGDTKYLYNRHCIYMKVFPVGDANTG